PRHPRGAAARVGAVRGDRGQGAARPGVPHAGSEGEGGGAVSAPVSRRDDLVRRWRATGGRARKLRGLIELLRPYRTRVALMFVALVLGTAAALAPPPLAKLAIDKGITPGNLQALTWIVAAFLL